MAQLVHRYGHEVVLSGGRIPIEAVVPIGAGVQVYVDVVLAGIEFGASDAVRERGGVPGGRHGGAGEVLPSIREGDTERGTAQGHPLHRDLDGDIAHQDAAPDVSGLLDGELRVGRCAEMRDAEGGGLRVER